MDNDLDKKIDERDDERENDKPENEAVDLNKKPLQSNSTDSEEISMQNDAADFTEMSIQNEDTDFTKKSIQNEEANFNEDAIAVGDDDNKANLLNADDKVDAAGKANSNDNNSDFQKQIAVPKKSHKTAIVVSLAFVFIVFLFFIFSTIFALVNYTKTTIISGVSVKNIDISGLSKEQALEKVSAEFSKKSSQSITLKYNDSEQTVILEQLGVSFDLENAINVAYSKGRTGNIFQNNYEILVSLLSGIKVNPGFSYNTETLDSLVNEMETSFPDRLINPSYYVEGNNLIISKGQNGVVVDKESLHSEISYLINNLDCSSTIINIPVVNKTAQDLSVATVHDEICKEPQNAYYTTNPYVVHPHVNGIDFSISIEEATELYNNCEDSCTIPLKVLHPSITTNDIGTEAFPDLLASYSTTYSTRNANRSTNIRLASQKINGTVLMPGETFSYNTTVGKRTAAAGFKSAAVYSGGKVTTGIGGGICQVSSTLYNAVLLSNLEIVERTNHGFNPGYVPAGRDATVSWGGPDFKFKNNRSYPVKIVCSGSGGTINFKIFGLFEKDEYEVEIQSYITQYISFKTITKQDASLAKGQTKVVQSGSNGCKAVAYRILKRNGEVVSKTLLSQDTYNPHNKIVAVGTK